SLEWLHDHNHGDAGVIFSGKKKRVKAVERLGSDQGKAVVHGHKKRKAGACFATQALKKW
ncbi:hypothetical protein A2U01_0051128, partial [Trifolium medium]|nr:hypothetical protein [Trifolium medium]